VADYDRQRGTLTLVVQQVGKTTLEMGALRAGDTLATLVGPLGNPASIQRYGTVLCVGGGSSIAAIYPVARALKAAGNVVRSIIGVRSADLVFWEEPMRAVSDELVVCTNDGTYGRKALVTEPMREWLEAGADIDHAFVIGPAIMMKFCCLTTAPFGLPTTVSVNSIMVDGTGMCGACRVEVGGQIRFACVDGPKFDGHMVNWDQLLARQQTYVEQERQALALWEETQP
jgi:ferredoxin--NADP+ reductase